MSEQAPALTPRQALWLVLVQLLVSLLGAAALWLFVDQSLHARSALVGGLIATTANGWFALKVFGRGQTRKKTDPARMLRSLYWGEINKLVLTGALFVAAFVLMRPVSGAALIVAYFVVHMTPFVASMFIRQQQH